MGDKNQIWNKLNKKAKEGIMTVMEANLFHYTEKKIWQVRVKAMAEVLLVLMHGLALL